MTKLFKQDSIIHIDDTLTVVIDRDAEIKLKDKALHRNPHETKLTNYQIIECNDSNKESIQEHWNKIILTIGTKRLDGVPVIKKRLEVGDLTTVGLITGVGDYAGELNGRMFEGNWIDGFEGIISEHKLTLVESAPKINFTEDDLRKAIDMARERARELNGDECHMYDEDQIIKSLKKPREIVELELEYIKIGLSPIEIAQNNVIESKITYKDNFKLNTQFFQLKIHNKENNSIIPVSIKYKS